MKPTFAVTRVIVLAVFLSVSVVPALAADHDEACVENDSCDNVPLVQITPFVVLESDPGAGGAVAVRWKPRVSIELDTDFGSDVLTSTASLVWRAMSTGRFAVYLRGGGGLQRRTFPTPLASGGESSGSRHRFGTAVGGGVDVSINSKWAVRGDVRWFNDNLRLATGLTLSLGR